MGKKLVSIKICGGCNPRIDRARIVAEVRDAMTAYSYEVVFNKLNADFIVYLSGCTANCAYHENNGSKPGVVVAAATIDTQQVDEAAISSLINQKVRICFEQPAKS